MKRIGIIESAMRYHRIMLLIVGLLVVLGVYGLVVMPKQEFPPFTIRQGLIVGVYPGATSEEVEEQLAKPLEQFLFTYKEVKKAKTYTLSQNGVVYAMVELNDEVHDKDEVWSKIKHGVANLKMQLPAGVLALVVNDDFGDTSALLISLQSEDKTYRELEGYLDDLEGRLRRIESVSNLRRYGLQKEQITVRFDPDKLAVYGLDQRALMERLFAQGFTTAGGTVEAEGQELPIRFVPVYDSEYEIAEQIVYSDPAGRVIRLRDVARVEREYDEPDSYVTNNGRKAVILSMEMREGNNIVQYGREVDEVLEAFEASLPDDVEVERIADQPKVVDESVTSFVRDLLVSIAVVILVMMVLFPFRSAVVAATSIPISIFISIGIMYMTGIPLNTATLAALIMVLGMIVDNSIIVVDAYLENLDRGMSRWYAAVASAKNYFGSIFLATLCICIIFFPLLVTMTGQFRDFLEDFPWTVTISLMVSLVLAMIFIPFLEYLLIRKGLKQRPAGRPEKKRRGSMLDRVERGYGYVLDWTFRWPKLTILGGVMTVVLACSILLGLKVRMMPFADRDQFAVEIFLPQGTALERTEAVADSVYRALAADERVKSVTQFIGTASPRFQATYAPNLPSKHYAQFIVNTQSVEATRGLLDEYANAWADRFPNAYVKFKQLDYQNLTTPIEVRFRGGDIAALKEAADTLMTGMRRLDGLVWVHTNYEEPLSTVAVRLDPVEAARLGIDRTVAQTELAACYSGFPAGTLWEGDYPLAVVLKAEGADADSAAIERIGDQYIATAVPGVSVPLRQVASVEPAWSEGQIVRRNGVRTLSVMADVRRGCNEGEAFKEVRRLVEAQTLPEGVEYEYGGAVESDAEITGPIVSGISAAAFIIFLFLLVNFKKVSISVVALVSISLCLLGAALGLRLTRTEFGLTCVLGLISLMGIIVRNAIIMFQHAEDLRLKKRIPAREAAYDAGRRRMMPIFLTSATTAVGVVPMIISRSSLWTPMGIVICFGTVVSMILVVTVLPVTYWKIFGNVKLKTKQPYDRA